MAEAEPDIPEAAAARVARNDAIFREANEKIAAAAATFSRADGVPFLCECADPQCRAIVLLTIDEYERIRADSTHFLNLPGHHVNAEGWARVVEDHGHYVVAEKIGRAGEITTELDERR